MKKAIVILTALALIFALCACGGSENSSASPDEAASTEAKPFFQGKWEMETLESEASMPDDFEAKVSMEITDIQSFTYTEKYTVEGTATELVSTGTFYEKDGIAVFTYTHTTADNQGSKTENNKIGKFTGRIRDDKLEITITSGGVPIKLVFHRTL